MTIEHREVVLERGRLGRVASSRCERELAWVANDVGVRVHPIALESVEVMKWLWVFPTRLQCLHPSCASVLRHQEVQIASSIRLKDVQGVKARVATLGNRRLAIRYPAPLELNVIDEQIEPAIRGVEPDVIAVPHERDRSPAAASGDTCRITVP